MYNLLFHHRKFPFSLENYVGGAKTAQTQHACTYDRFDLSEFGLLLLRFNQICPICTRLDFQHGLWIYCAVWTQPAFAARRPFSEAQKSLRLMEEAGYC